MSVWLKILVVWLMALALPAQGLAAATLMHCGQSQQRHHSAPAVLPDATAHQHHAMVHAQRADKAEPSATASTDNPQPQTALAKIGCSACAACCTAALLASEWPQLAAPEAAPASFATLVRSIEAVASDGPDRPPRLALV